MKELLSLIIIVFRYCNFNIIAFIHVTNSYTPMKRMVQKNYCKFRLFLFLEQNTVVVNAELSNCLCALLKN